MLRRRITTVVPVLLLALPVLAAPIRTRDAVVVRLTEADANRVMLGAFRAKGGPVFSGTRDDARRGVHGLSYEIRLSDPVLSLGGAGSASLSFAILEADVSIASLERKILWQHARCENAGVYVDSDHPIDLALDLDFVVEDGDLRLVPLDARSPGAEDAIHLVKPERCSNTIFPRWMLWGLGKKHLKRRMGQVDRLLLDRARDVSSDLAEHGLLREEWEVGSTRFTLEPSRVDTAGGALTLTFDGVQDGAGDAAETATEPVATAPLLPADTTMIAVSETIVNQALDAAFTGMTGRVRRPAGDFRRLMKSDAVLALMPGLRDVDSRTRLEFQVRLDAAPRVRFLPLAPGTPGPAPEIEQVSPSGADRAVVEVEISGLSLDVLRNESEVLGTLTIDRGLVRAVPFVNRLAGIAFEPIENVWHVSSTGLEFDEPLLQATIQELVFGALFETRFEPLAEGGLAVGDTRLVPRSVSAADGYLVITLGGDAPPPASIRGESAMRTDSPRASR